MTAKYDTIGIDYNNTRKADKYLTERLLQNLVPDKGKLFLDIGCGTGNYTIELYHQGFNIIGIDPSLKMLQIAKSKCSEIQWHQGTAEDTGLEDNSIDGIIGTLTIHHWPDLPVGFKELGRVLKEDGRIVLFTSTPEQMEGYWLNHYFPEMLKSSILQMPSLDMISKAMEDAGILVVEVEKYDVKPDLSDQFLYCGKSNPRLYLKPEVRNGISSFSSLANAQEVKKGLNRLNDDITSGRINAIMSLYENDKGDYLFIRGRKV